MNASSTLSLPMAGNRDDASYHKFLKAMQVRFMRNIGDGVRPLFTTNAAGLFDAYLNAFPPEDRQFHNCNACRHFIERYAGLVTLTDKGHSEPAILFTADADTTQERHAIRAMVAIIREAGVTGVFLSSESQWGTAQTGEWSHMAVTPPPSIVHKSRTETAHQAMAKKAEGLKTVRTFLHEHKEDAFFTAYQFTKSDALYRSEKVHGQAEWLWKLKVATKSGPSRVKDNILWLAVATAPEGFLHPRAGMIGTLIEDIAAGLPFDEVAAKFRAKMDPTQYQRPTAAPAAQTILQAEGIVGQLQAAGSLARRFCRLDEVQALWRPKPIVDASGVGVFGTVKPRAAGRTVGRPTVLPAQTMTWDKFQRTVLPSAQGIEAYLPPTEQAIAALVTAVNPDAPPILQWDREEKRNPVSWYVWQGGSTPASFSLMGHWNPVAAVCLKPSMWNGGNEHQGKSVLFLIEGAKETRMAGAALFPEILRSEFNAVRKVVEAYSKDAKIEGFGEPSACGPVLEADRKWDFRCRVTAGGATTEYLLDRWD